MKIGFERECSECTTVFKVGRNIQQATCSPECRVARNARVSGDRSQYLRDYQIKRNYGLTGTEREEMAEAQGGRCAVCKRIPAPGRNRDDGLRVDHNHETGANRALLCKTCNLGLGFFGDSVELLMAAAAYLLQHSDVLDGRSFQANERNTQNA